MILSRPSLVLNTGQEVLVDAEDMMRYAPYLWFLKGPPGGKYAYSAKLGDYLHKLIHPAAPGFQTDHRNGDRLDCRRDNLRDVPPSRNKLNVDGAHRDSATGVLGVCRARSKFQAYYRRQYLGTFATLGEATQARLAAERADGIEPRRAAAHG